MWVFTETGFVSAVRKKDKPEVLNVRSRDRYSLEDLAGFSGAEIIETPYGDYPLRLFVEADVFAEWVKLQAEEIDYSNFKSRVSQTRDDKFVDALHDVWVAMLKTTDKS